MNTEQLKQAALNGDPDAASPEQVLALLECVDAAADGCATKRSRHADDRRGIASVPRSTPKAGGSMKPDIAQAIHDAAVSGQLDGLDNVARIILSDAFMSIIDWTITYGSHRRGFWGWIETDEGRTYMLLVAEALS